MKKNFNKLTFKKANVTELNNKSLQQIVGGSTEAVVSAVVNIIINAVKDKVSDFIDNIGQPIIK